MFNKDMEKYYANPSSMHICFPMKIKKSVRCDIDMDLIPVSNFLSHSIKEIHITKYGINIWY